MHLVDLFTLTPFYCAGERGGVMKHAEFGLVLLIATAAAVVGGAGFTLLFSGDPVFAQKTPSTATIVTAEQFRLVDQAGETRASLSVEGDGTPRLDLHDQNGHRRVGLYLLPNGAPRLGLFDETGMHRALLALLPNGEPGLIFFDRSGTPHTSLAISPDGNSRLVLGDKDGTVAWEAP